MSSYQQLEVQLANDLIHSFPGTVPGKNQTGTKIEKETVSLGGMLPDLVALIDALPYYGDTAWSNDYRGALVNLLAVSLPNDKISPQPFEYGFGYSIAYFYEGPYNGYRDAFFHGITKSPAAVEIANQVAIVNKGITTVWWAAYSLALLTDAARSQASVPVDTSKLASTLASYNGGLLPALSATYLAVLTEGFSPTANAWARLAAAGETASARVQLEASIKSPTFIANSNEAISMGGDSTNAAVWFLYNNWILLRILGADVDQVITDATSAGLTVPPEIGPGTWWSGGYTEWYVPLSGADVVSVTAGRLTETMPESMLFSSGGVIPVPTKTSAKNGYSLSLCEWGALANYKPPPACCLGTGTGILMADGSVRPIETVRIGDAVWTEDGPHKVALVESPPQAGRALTQINDLAIFVTPGHPLRCHDPDGPRHAAVGGWTLRDSTPTMTEHGVVELVEGVGLHGMVSGTVSPVVVSNLTIHPQADGDARVYDLLLENWERCAPVYFVGGPDTFVGVEAESSNPLREPSSSIALLTALDESVPTSRTKISAPEKQLAAHVARLDPHTYHEHARIAAWLPQEGKVQHPSIPGPEYYMQDDAWEPHASMIEVYLLRRFSRSWRRLLATGWRSLPGHYQPNDSLSVLVHDLEIVGETSIPENAKISISVTLLTNSVDTGVTRTVNTQPSAMRRWHPRFDDVLGFGPQWHDSSASLLLIANCDDVRIGRAQILLASLEALPETEHFLFDKAGEVTARLSLDTRWQGANANRMEADRRSRWSTKQARLAACAIGSELGRNLRSSLENEPTCIE